MAVLVLIQIPCLNEAGTLGAMLESLAVVETSGDSVRLLLINDGSADSTVDIARAAGVDRVVSHTRNRGLAAAFTTGLDECLRMGADIIVNTDGDGQYPASEIPRLLEPILAGRADMVIGDRRPSEDVRSSWLKRKLQKLGSRTVSWLAGREIPDAVSGFRAMTREAAIKMHVVTGFSYTIETVLQACSIHTRYTDDDRSGSDADYLNQWWKQDAFVTCFESRFVLNLHCAAVPISPEFS